MFAVQLRGVGDVPYAIRQIKNSAQHLVLSDADNEQFISGIAGELC